MALSFQLPLIGMQLEHTLLQHVYESLSLDKVNERANLVRIQSALYTIIRREMNVLFVGHLGGASLL